MFESPFVYALVFFGLGFIAGLIVALLFQAGKGRPPEGSGDSGVKQRPDQPAVPLESDSGHIHQGGSETARTGVEKVEMPPNASLEPVTWVSSLSGEPQDQPEGVRANPIESFLHVVRGSTVNETARPRTMAAEIDAIIQEKLPASNLAGRVVRIVEQPDFGLLVVVDGQQYAGVNAVPDEEVRSLIQRAVAEWQDRNSSTTRA